MKPEHSEFKPLTGSLLAASPGLMDPNFRETLIYLADHSEEGAFGLVMNRPLGKTLGEVISLPDLSEKLSNVQVFYGGPVRPNNLLIGMFTMKPADEQLVCQLNSHFTDTANFLEQEDGWVAAFAGYSGWGEGQLEGELDQEAWKICHPDPILFNIRMLHGLWHVFVADDARWRNLLKYLPEDPELN